MVLGNHNLIPELFLTTNNSFVWVFSEKNRVCSASCSSVMDTLPASNGVAYVIDSVLKPANKETIAGILSEDMDYATLWSVLMTAGLQDDLDSSSFTWTFFAPSEQAWDATFSKEQFDCLSPDDKEIILKHHLLNGTIVPSFLFESQSYVTAASSNLPVVATSVGIIVDYTPIVKKDTFGTNGVIQKIDQVLLPAQYTYDWFKSNCNISATLWDALKLDNSLDSFSTLLEERGYADELSRIGTNYTVFAPLDFAWALLTEDQLNDVSVDLLVSAGKNFLL